MRSCCVVRNETLLLALGVSRQFAVFCCDVSAIWGSVDQIIGPVTWQVQ